MACALPTWGLIAPDPGGEEGFSREDPPRVPVSPPSEVGIESGVVSWREKGRGSSIWGQKTGNRAWRDVFGSSQGRGAVQFIGAETQGSERERRLMCPRAMVPRQCGSVGVEDGLSGGVLRHGLALCILIPPNAPHSGVFAFDTPRRSPLVQLCWLEWLSWGRALWIR